MGQAQGTHNAAEEVTKLEPPDAVLLEENSGRTYWDAPLTPKGQAQAAALRRSLQAERRLSPPAAASGGADGAAVPRLELVVSSTLRRALETATIVFDTASRNSKPAGVRWVATELCRERVANFTCDGRSDRSALQQQFPHFDFGEVAEEADPMWAEKEEEDGERRSRERAVAFAQVIPTPSHLLGRIPPIFPPFSPVFCAFSPSRRGGSNEPKTGTQGQETVPRAPKHRFAGPSNSGCWERMVPPVRV